MMKKTVVTVAAMAMMGMVSTAQADMGTYRQACAACHNSGAAGAPKLGDKAAWAPRIKQGLDALVASAIKGKGAMPPKGGRADLSDDKIKAVVELMVNQSK